MVNERTLIVAAILIDRPGKRVLLSRRKTDVHMGGCWEYPGGKIEPGESPWQALRRELHEELGIEVSQGEHFKTLEYDYPDRKISLSTWSIDSWRGKPIGMEGQSIQWFDIDSLHELNFPDANVYITRLIQLQALYVITPDRCKYDEEFFSTVETLLENGLRLLQFLSRSCPVSEHGAVLRQLLELCESMDCRVLYNGAPDVAVKYGAHGVHLNSKRLMGLSARPLPSDIWVSASCHTPTELKHAVAIGADFCVLSPIHQTSCHPEATPMGWESFSSMVRGANLPVYALGGPGDLQQAREAGAKGISILSGIWNASDLSNELKELNV